MSTPATLTLQFHNESSRLLKSVFCHNRLDEKQRTAVRFRREGDPEDWGTFNWSVGIRAFSSLVLRSVLAHLENDSSMVELRGKRGSLAMTLSYLRDKADDTAWVQDMFGLDKESDIPLLKRLVNRQNARLADGEDVVLTLNSEELPPENIAVVWGERDISNDARKLSLLLQHIELERLDYPNEELPATSAASSRKDDQVDWRYQDDETGFVLVVRATGDLSDLSPEAREKVIDKLWRVLGVSSARPVAEWSSGSILLAIRNLTKTQAQELLNEIESGLLDEELSVSSVSIETSDVFDMAPLHDRPFAERVPEQIMSDQDGAVPVDTTEASFLATLKEFDRTAVGRKHAYALLRATAIVASWGTILMAFAALLASDPQLVAWAVWVVPICNSAISLCTLLQMLGVSRDGWIACRIAAERMRHNWIAYQTGLGRFAGSNAAEELEHVRLKARRRVAQRGPRRLAGRIIALLDLLRSKKTTWEQSTQDAAVDADAARLLSLVANQRTWHFTKARRRLRLDLLLQALVIVLSGVGVALSVQLGPGFWMVFVLNVVIQTLLGARQFFDLPERYFHSFAVAQRLDDVGFRYKVDAPPFKGLGVQLRTRRLGEELLSILEDGLASWKTTIGKYSEDVDEIDVAS